MNYSLIKIIRPWYKQEMPNLPYINGLAAKKCRVPKMLLSTTTNFSKKFKKTLQR